MPKVIEVKFNAQNGADDLFISTGFPKKFYVRQPLSDGKRVAWLTASKQGDHEPDTPIKAGTTMRVVAGIKKEKATLFEEVMEVDDANTTSSAQKNERFSGELIDATVQELIKGLGLHDYDGWSKWLLSERERFGYTGYPDNWLHFGTTPVVTREHECVNILGASYMIVATEWRHMICGKNWVVYELKDSAGNVIELCGYQFAP